MWRGNFFFLAFNRGLVLSILRIKGWAIARIWCEIHHGTM